MTSTTRPASFIPPAGNSRPYWLKVTLAWRDSHCAGRSPGFAGSDCLATPRLLTITSPWPMCQS